VVIYLAILELGSTALRFPHKANVSPEMENEEHEEEPIQIEIQILGIKT